MTTIDLVLNTQEGQVFFVTEKIQGSLKGIIIDTKDKAEVIVQSSKGYDILHVREHLGVNYYAPRAILRQPDKSILGFDQFDEFYLDESLEIIVRGQKNKQIGVSIRYS